MAQDFISPQFDHNSRAIKATNAGEDAAEQEHLYTVGGHEN
jgi:hypothetical protein